MPIYSPTGNLDITNATLRTSNIETQHIQISNVAISAAHNLQQVTSIGNATTNTIEFNNPTTSLTTASNVTVGNELTVSGNIISNQETTLTGNVTVGKNILLSSNTTTRVDSNVVVEHFGPHKRYPITPVLKKFPDVDFTQGKFDYNDSTRTYAQAGYVVSASSQSSGSEVWRLFDDGEWDQEAIDKYTSASSFQYNPTSNPNALGGVSGEWFKVEFPRKVIIDKIILNVGNTVNPGPKAFKVLGSDDDTSWTEVKDVSGLTQASYSTSAPYKTTVESVSSTAFRYYAVVITQLLAVARVSISEVEFYGYEENPPAGDTSIDTTFTSVMNTPQTGGVKVYVDGSTLENKITTGPTPTSTGATYDSTGKYWSITSNISVEANTFMSGDQPHSVSMWFNSSNLEANTANTCVFSVSDQEKLDSVNLDLQSNTWHNLTYAYQGEGGSRVTYLDGRKVSEDQAEDTFGEYPPFAMTGYSQGGYVLSVDADHDGTNKIWKAFDGDDSSSSVWFSQPGTGDADSSYQAGYARGNPGQSVTDTNGTTHSGSWGKIEFPYKFVLNYVRVHGGTPVASYIPHNPDNYVILGSNDDTNWDLLTTRTGASDITNGMTTGGTNIDQHPVNATKAYKYIKFLVTKLGWTSGDREFIIASLKLYGHRENDLVRLPDPTNVLKYPHIAMTGPAQRGYVASASSTYTPDYKAWKMFADDGASNPSPYGGYGWWVSQHGKYRQSGDNDYLGGTTDNLGTYTGSSTATDNGVWVQLKMPHKILLSSVFLGNAAWYETAPGSFKIYGTNNDQDWTLIQSFTGKNPQAGTSYAINATVAYKTIGLVITHTAGTALNSGETGISEMKFYGTGVDSIPIQIGGGNIDRVANFRVYDKFVGEDQALEIWDAQKDEFGRAKSSMTLHKGRLGIGTTEPEGRFAVLDEPNGLEEFPPSAMTGNKTYIEGHGEFCTSASNTYQTGEYESYKAFNKNSTGTSGNWWSQSDIASVPTYSTSTGEFSSTDSSYSTNVEGATKYGHWLQIEFPYKINYKYSEIEGAHHNTGRQPRAGYILGSNDLTGVWTSLHTFTNVTRTHVYESVRYTPPTVSTQTFKYFRLVIEEQDNYQYAGIARWDIFGTREQGQSVLHDGQLTLTKNLDVPRIGPPLDADDTPRRDRLVVEYNTSSNPTFEGVVRDTSGRGNDGLMVNGASYDATDKALVFDGTNDYVRTNNLKAFVGDQAHTIGGWFKRTNLSTTRQDWFVLGTVSTNGASAFSIYTSGASTYAYGFSNDIYSTTNQIPDTSWYHVMITFVGGIPNTTNKKVYINGVDVTSNFGNGTATQIQNFRADSFLVLGTDSGLINYPAPLKISNFKLYDCALTASEVKTLYDMGRCDEGQHAVNFSKTRVGIGLGDGEAPTSTLDVRGTFQGNSPLRFYVLEGVHPSSGSQFVDLPPGCIGSRIVSITGMTFNTNGDGVPFERHSESQWEVDVYYSTYSSNPTYSNKFILSSQGSAALGKPWKMFVVTT